MGADGCGSVLSVAHLFGGLFSPKDLATSEGMWGLLHTTPRKMQQTAAPRKRGHGFLPTFITFSTLTFTAHGAAPACEDSGPWPCTEAGCPGPKVGCGDLKGDCGRTFGQVFTSPPENLGATAVWQVCKKTCNRCEDPQAAADKEKCVSWRQTSECSPMGKRQPHQDQACKAKIQSGWSGYCECDSGVRAGESNCEHEIFTCADKCAKQFAWLREQRAAKKGDAPEEEFSADDALGKLYKRGKQFYVMGNTELALRHFREALKLDPEHKQCKKEYKQAKKLSKLMEKIEGVLGKDVEGKGRIKQLEREEQYEEARVLLEDALNLTPPAVYRSSLYRDLCICSTKTRRNEDALKHCTKHESHDSGSMPAKILFAEALLLNEKYEEAMAVRVSDCCMPRASIPCARVPRLAFADRVPCACHPSPLPVRRSTRRSSRWMSTPRRGARGWRRRRSCTSAPRRLITTSCST